MPQKPQRFGVPAMKKTRGLSPSFSIVRLPCIRCAPWFTALRGQRRTTRRWRQRKKGYFFIRRLAANPPKPNTIPITIMLGSGTTASEDRLATRKPKMLFSLLGRLLPRVDDDRPLELFQRLWQPLFTPAISLLMGAALLSGVLGWWQRRALR